MYYLMSFIAYITWGTVDECLECRSLDLQLAGSNPGGATFSTHHEAHAAKGEKVVACVTISPIVIPECLSLTVKWVLVFEGLGKSHHRKTKTLNLFVVYISSDVKWGNNNETGFFVNLIKHEFALNLTLILMNIKCS